MQELALCLSICLSGVCLGVMGFLLVEAKAYRAWYLQKCKDLEVIMKVAEEAHLSFANKILRLEEQVNNIEFWKSTSTGPKGR